VEQQISAAVLKVARALLASGFDESVLGDTPADDERPPYTVPEAAKALKVDNSTIYRAIQAGEIDAYSVGTAGRAIRIPAEEFAAFKARRMIAAHRDRNCGTRRIGIAGEVAS
jgi:excisionase family DNA binding protein